MKIALSFSGCHRRGGVERVLVEAANHLAGRGHEVHVFSAEFDAGVLAPSIQPRPLRPRRVPAPFRAMAFRRASNQLQRSETFDAHGGFGVLAPPNAIAWAQSVHAAWLEISRRHHALRDRLRQRLNPFHPAILHLERHVYAGRRYRHLLALTSQVKADLMRFYNVPDQDITVLPNGYRPEEFNPQRRAELRDPVRQELRLSNDHRVLVFVANEPHRKGLWPLMRAMAAMNDPQLALLAVGRLDRSAIEHYARQLGIADQVRAVGPTPDVARYYAASDAFVLPTQYEAWGLVIVEAMACGLPVLTSRCAGAAEAVEEGVTGELLDEPRDEAEIAAKLDRLLRYETPDPQAISQSVARYAWPAILNRYEDILSRFAEPRCASCS